MHVLDALYILYVYAKFLVITNIKWFKVFCWGKLDLFETDLFASIYSIVQKSL